MRLEGLATWDGGNSTWGGRARVIGKEGCASWDLGKGTWGGRVRVLGTVPVCVRVQESENRGGVFLVGRFVKGELFGLLGFGGLAISVPGLRAEVEVSGSHSTQEETPNVAPIEISEEDVQNMMQIILMDEFKVEALQVKYPLIDWEIYSEGSRTY
nr:hypothetical protein [Tanacetum cinerariifolium]